VTNEDIVPREARGETRIARIYIEGEVTVELPSDVDPEDEQSMHQVMREAMAETDPTQLDFGFRIVNYEFGSMDAAGRFVPETR
jgi:hypothetical protein